MPIERVEAFAAQGVTRIFVGATATEPEQQRDELSAFAERFALLDHLRVVHWRLVAVVGW
jgi:hypothetical protein